jgi:hypothetical protein
MAARRRLAEVILLAVLGLVAGRHPAVARRRKPTPCDPGSFMLDADAARQAETLLGLSAPVLTTTAERRLVLGECDTAMHRKVTKHATILSAVFGTCGAAHHLRFKASIAAPGCDAMHGTLRVKRKKKVTFSAERGVPTTTTLAVATTTTTSTTVTTLPAGSSTCRNGIREPGEQCDHDPQCGRRAICTPDCTCMPLPGEPEPTTEQKIDDALQAGQIDYGTSLLYRAYAFYGDARLPPEFDGDGVEEDIALAGEVAAAGDSLSPDVRATLNSFLVRPTAPGSVFSLAGSGGFAVAADAAAPCGPSACGTWVSSVGAHFTVWACDSVDAGTRDGVLADAESLYAPMTSYMGEPVPDTEGPATIDIYIVDVGDGVLRDGVCKPLAREAGAAVGCAYSTPQDLHALSGAPVSSGFIELLLSQATSPNRKSTLAHEFFHVQEFAYNTFVTQGSWLTESSAVWAEWRFVPETADAVVHTRLPTFQARDNVPLTIEGGLEPYAAYIFHLFAQQDVGADAMKRLWSGLSSIGVISNYEYVVNQIVPFKTHFGEFALRNLNNIPLLMSKATTYGGTLSGPGLDHPPPNGVSPEHVEERNDLGTTPADVMVPASITYLSAKYLHFTAPDSAQQITFDFSQLQPATQLDVHLLLKGTQGWTTMHPTDSKLTLCRDEDGYPGTEAYVVLANTQWEHETPVAGTLRLQTAPACCKSGKSCWVGTASHTKSITAPLPGGVGSATVNFTATATVTWLGIPQDPTGTIFQPTGSLTVGPLTGNDGPCSFTAPQATFPITPELGQLQLLFLPGKTPQYTGEGSAPSTASWLLTITCPSSDPGTLPIEVPVWFLTGGFQNWTDPTLSTISGQFSKDGDVYGWNFQRVGG